MGVGAREENLSYQGQLQGSEKKKLPSSGQRQRQYSLEKIGL